MKKLKNMKNLDLTPRPDPDEVQPGKPTKMMFFDRWPALRAGLRSVFWLDRPEFTRKKEKHVSGSVGTEYTGKH